MSVIALPTTMILIVAVGVLRAVPASTTLAWLHLLCWIGLALLALPSIRPKADLARRQTLLILTSLAISTFLIFRLGRFECWSLFSTLCEFSPPKQPSWDVVYVNEDTLTYLMRVDSNALRPPLYHWFMRAATFYVPLRGLVIEALSLLPYESNPQELVSYLSAHPQPLLLRIAHAEQFVLWAGAVFFAWCAARVVPLLGVALVILALYDGGVLTHAYFTHAIEAKILYLACFFGAAGASLLVAQSASKFYLWLTAAFCAALPLIRPQGLVAGVLVCVAALRFVVHQPRLSKRSIGIATAAISLFVMAAALPTAITYIGHGVLQPSNIFALSQVAPALELANEDDIRRLPDEFTMRYLKAMLAVRDDGGKPADINASLARNQNIAVNTCHEIGEGTNATFSCADAMNTVASAVLRRHRGDYLEKIVLPAIARLGREHVGGSVASVPNLLILTGALIAIVAFIAPWIAAWAAAIVVLHVSLLVLLAALAGPFSAYLITSEPVLISVAAVLLMLVLTRATTALGKREKQAEFGGIVQ